MGAIENRQEILFLYEAKDCNPNGDPLDENRPRTDVETGVATVTDVRIKRTVRDYILSLESDVGKRMETGREILIRDTLKNDGYLAEGKDRAKAFISQGSNAKDHVAIGEEILKRCIDARLFGATLPLGKDDVGIKITGPVQFMAFNRSLNKVNPQLVQQTAAYAGKAKANQKSFAERWLLPYAIIAAYGVANEVAARTTNLTDEDMDILLEALWKGTASLNTHSKIGHAPLMLINIKYKPGYRLGSLPERISLKKPDIEDQTLRCCGDFKVDISGLLEGLAAYSDKIVAIRVSIDDRLALVDGNKEGSIAELAKARQLQVERLIF